MKNLLFMLFTGWLPVLAAVDAGAIGWRPTGKGDLLCQAYRFECQPELGRMVITRETQSCSWDGEAQEPLPDAAKAEKLAQKYNIFYPKFYSVYTVKEAGFEFPARHHNCQIGENLFEVEMDLIPNWAHPTWICMQNLYFLRANVSLNGTKVVDDLAFALPCKVGHHEPDGQQIEKMEFVPLRVPGASIDILTDGEYPNKKLTDYHVNYDGLSFIDNKTIHGKDINKDMFFGMPYRP